MTGIDTSQGPLAGRYLLTAVIGRGGMGVVWRAEDLRLSRPVAVKQVVLPPAASDRERSDTRARVVREAQSAARIGHPAVVTVFDVIDDDPDHLFVVMELVDGSSLESRVHERGALDPVEAAALGERLAGAIETAHSHGIVHRDLKPSNVLLPGHGSTAKLVDFGIAAILDDPRLTSTGLVLGSPAYMAPEQAQGEPVGPAVDAWGLGATLYFAVEGESPFRRETTMATLAAVVNQAPRVCRRAGPLEPVLLALLEKDPGRRLGPSDARPRLAAVARGESDATRVQGAYGGVVVPPPPPPPSPLSRRRPLSCRRPAPAAPASRRRFPVRLATVALGAAAVVLVVAGVRELTDDDGGDASASASTTTVPITTTTTSAPPESEAVVPADWVRYDDPQTGFVISHPPDWSVRTNRTLTDFVAPDGTTFLRVDHTDEPGDDPVQAWEDLAADFASRNEGYEELRIEPSSFEAFQGAVWEFRHVDHGVVLHTIDQSMLTGDFGFALLFRAPESEYDQLLDVFAQFRAGFDPPSTTEEAAERIAGLEQARSGNGNGRGNGNGGENGEEGDE